jgi:hypothetical protein
LSLLTALPEKQRALIPDGQPVVAKIVVADMKALEREREAALGSASSLTG